MKAILFHQHGDTSVLHYTDIPEPHLRHNEVEERQSGWASIPPSTLERRRCQAGGVQQVQVKSRCEIPTVTRLCVRSPCRSSPLIASLR